MEDQQQAAKSRVVKVDSVESWDLFITQANNQGSPVFVHFSASWCVPSLAMNSYFEELAMKYQDIVFLLVDVDELKGSGVGDSTNLALGPSLGFQYIENCHPGLTPVEVHPKDRIFIASGLGVASKMEVKAMPTFVLMRHGEVVTKFVGANPEEMRRTLEAFAHSLLPTNVVE